MRIEQTPIESPEWVRFVDAHPEASPFHLPAWTSTIADCYGFEAFALIARSAGQVLAGLPVVAVRSPLGVRRWISLPYSDSCELLTAEDIDEEALAASLREYIFERGIGELELRGALSPVDSMHRVNAGYEHIIELPSDPAQLRIRKSMRNNRNLAKREGTEIVYGTSAEDVEEFYRLQALTRQRLGVPVQPKRFFALMGERMISAGHGFVAHARRDDKTLASGIFLTHNNKMVAKFGASDHDHRGSGAGVLLDWEIMVRASREGYRTLDLGRTDADADGLRAYKEGLGAVELPLCYTRISASPPKPHTVRSNSKAASWLIRHSPLWVCRGLGELLYRFAA